MPGGRGDQPLQDLAKNGVSRFIRKLSPFNEWTEVLGSERMTGALLDRLTHHVHILEMNGESFRLKQSRKKRSRSSD